MRKKTLLVAMLFAACAGAQKETDGERRAHIEASPGMQCIMDAETVLNPPADAPGRIDAAHILVRHAGVANPGDATRTREEACLRALEARQKLLSGVSWDDVFEEYSDARGAAGGELYQVSQDDLARPFAGAAFSLKVDELSYPVETNRGFHIIWRKK
jgi:hypothetical protein